MGHRVSGSGCGSWAIWWPLCQLNYILKYNVIISSKFWIFFLVFNIWRYWFFFYIDLIPNIKHNFVKCHTSHNLSKNDIHFIRLELYHFNQIKKNIYIYIYIYWVCFFSSQFSHTYFITQSFPNFLLYLTNHTSTTTHHHIKNPSKKNYIYIYIYFFFSLS